MGRRELAMSTTISASATRALLGILTMSNRTLKPVKIGPDKEQSQHNREDNRHDATNHLVTLGPLGEIPSRTGSEGRVRGGATLTLTAVFSSGRESRGDRVVVVVVEACGSGGIGDHGGLVDHTVVRVLMDVLRRSNARVVVRGGGASNKGSVLAMVSMGTEDLRVRVGDDRLEAGLDGSLAVVKDLGNQGDLKKGTNIL
jgi:hypothetical protein